MIIDSPYVTSEKVMITTPFHPVDHFLGLMHYKTVIVTQLYHVVVVNHLIHQQEHTNITVLYDDVHP